MANNTEYQDPFQAIIEGYKTNDPSVGFNAVVGQPPQDLVTPTYQPPTYQPPTYQPVAAPPPPPTQQVASLQDRLQARKKPLPAPVGPPPRPERPLSELAAEARVQNMGDVEAGLRSGWEGFKGLGALAASAAGQATSEVTGGALGNDLQRWGYEKYLETEEAAKPYQEGRTTRVEDIEGLGSALDWFQFTVGSAVPSLAESIAAGVAGAAIGSAATPAGSVLGAAGGAVAKGAVKQVLAGIAKKGLARGLSREAAEKMAGKVAGGSIGTFLAGYQMGVGEIYGETIDPETGKGNASIALLNAIPYAGVEALTDMTLAGKVLTGGQGAKLVTRVLRGMGEGAVLEGMQEFTQEGINIVSGLQDGKTYETADVISRLGNALAAGAVVGGGIGGIGGVRQDPDAGLSEADKLARLALEGRPAPGGIDAAQVDKALKDPELDPAERARALAAVEANLTARDPLLGQMWREASVVALADKRPVADVLAEINRGQTAPTASPAPEARSYTFPFSPDAGLTEPAPTADFRYEPRSYIRGQTDGSTPAAPPTEPAAPPAEGPTPPAPPPTVSPAAEPAGTTGRASGPGVAIPAADNAPEGGVDGFTPTHISSDGEPLRATDTPRVYVDANGVEVEDAYADPIQQDTETGQGPPAAPPAAGPGQAPAPTAPETDAGAEPAAEGIRRGEVGGKLSAGEVVLTTSGRQTTPFPKLTFGSERKATNTVKRVDNWLLENAALEAEARGDEFNARTFRSALGDKNKTQADKDSAEQYLFGEQPDVLPPITRPLAPRAESKARPGQPAVRNQAVPKPASNQVDAPEFESVTDLIPIEKQREVVAKIATLPPGRRPSAARGQAKVLLVGKTGGERDLTDIVRGLVAAAEPKPTAQAPGEAAGQQRTTQAPGAESARQKEGGLEGFLGKLGKMLQGRSRKALEGVVRANGRVISRRDLVEAKVAGGATITTAKDGTRRLSNPDETFVDQNQIGKVAMDYAAHLIEQRDAKQNQTQSPVPNSQIGNAVPEPGPISASEPMAEQEPTPQGRAPETRAEVAVPEQAGDAEAEIRPTDMDVEGAAPTADLTPAVTVSSNTIFTDDAAEKARALLRKKLGQLSSGVDPEVLQAGIVLAGWHIEKGARTFAAYSKAVMADMGDMVRPYLKQWYMAVKMDPRATDEMKSEMDSLGAVEDADLDAILSTPRAQPKRTDASVRSALVADLVDGRTFASITQARARIAELTGEKIEAGTAAAKRADEMIEQAGVFAARRIVEVGGTEAAVYDKLVDLQQRMPSLNVRSSTSVEQQAYSTPLPLAYAASRFANAANAQRVAEPTAGNGALLLEVVPARGTEINELNPDRVAFLREQGFDVTQRDASDPRPTEGHEVDALVTNPPFGIVKEADGKTSRRFDLTDIQQKYTTTEIDHAIALRSLEELNDSGRAVLIVGAPAKTLTEKGRSDAYNAATKRKFYYTLYQKYRVTDHFTVSGDLYAKQGAAWPVDVIVIEGRGKSDRVLPAANLPRIIQTWEQLRDVLVNREKTAERQRSGANQPSVAPEEPAGRGPGPAIDDVRPGGAPDQSGRRAGPQQRKPDSVRERPARGTGNVGQGSVPVSTTAAAPVREGRGTGPGNTAARGAVDAPQNTYQAPYQPQSTANVVGTLVPTNMRTAVSNALARVAERYGNVDTFVADRLGYKTADIPRYFSAEQVDALALALDNVERGKGFIIGDQTGVGKGRVVAAVIRYAKRQGRVPVFATEKPNLYGDMLRDLTDIGMPDFNPLPTNAGFEIPLDDDARAWYARAEAAKEQKLAPPPKVGQFLKTPGGGKHNAELTRMAASGDLGGYDAIFTTYNQMQTVKGERSARHEMLERMAEGGILILDESHNAGGQEKEARSKKEQAEADPSGKTGRAAFVRQMMRSAHGVFYSSATYAKRPEVMDLYARTDMGMAAESSGALANALEAGGVPLQQVVAAMLADAGQYIRREKSFDGIEYTTQPAETNKQFAENASEIMRRIMEFDGLKQRAVDGLDNEIKAQARTMTSDRSTGGAGAMSTNFTSVVHNLISQMLLTLKVQPAIERALEALRAGEKPVLALSNTMGSAIAEYAEETGLKPGDAIALSFGDLLKRYLEKSRRVIEGTAFGEKTTRYLTDVELGPVAVNFYRDTLKRIDEMGFNDAPISPIDAIHQALRNAGYKTGEITGRSDIIDYSGAVPVYRRRPAAETTPAGKTRTINDFNNGSVDAIILNQSGATGLSLHASEKFADQRRRVMILAQPELNIDTHMQMLGRINRTGQVTGSDGKAPAGKPAVFGLPRYEQLVADIPAENRPAAILANKMALLNANTTAAKDSALKAKDVPDFMNEYGDQVAAEVMAADDALHKALGKPLPTASKGDGLEPNGAMRRVTGRIPVLPLAKQEEVYQSLADGYAELLDTLTRMGENKLEAQTLDLDAKTIKSVEVAPKRAGADSPFADGVRAETVDVKRLGKPMKFDDAVGLVLKTLGVESKEGSREARDKWVEDNLKMVNDAVDDERQAMMDDADTSDAKGQKRLDANLKRLEGQHALVTEAISAWMPTTRVKVRVGQTTMLGVVSNIERKGAAKNPVAPGAWRITILVADAAKQIKLPLSRVSFNSDQEGKATLSGGVSKSELEAAFDEGQSESRELRTMVTGNLLSGFASFRGAGQVVNFTDNTGAIRQGILMPRTFKLDDELKKVPAHFQSPETVGRFLRTNSDAAVSALDAEGLLLNRGADGYSLTVPKAKATGARWFLNRALVDAVGGDFVSAGSQMRAQFGDERLDRVLRALYNTGTMLKAQTRKDEARELIKAEAAAGDGTRFSRPATTPNGRVPVGRTPRGIAVEVAQRVADTIGTKLLGKSAGRVRVRVVAKQSDAFGMASYDRDGRIRGAYDPRRNEVVLVAENLNSAPEARQVLRHEIRGHVGWELLQESDKPGFVERVLAATESNRWLRDLRTEVEAVLGPNAPKDLIAEEVFARAAESGRTALGRAWDRLLTWIASRLRAAGFNWIADDVAQLRVMQADLAAAIRAGREVGTVGGEARFSFAGVRAETTDKHALTTAQQRLNAGEDAEVVRQETGWFRGDDDKWRFEIDDADATLTPNYADFKGIPAALSDVLAHPALFAAYPEIGNIGTFIEVDPDYSTEGSYDDKRGIIVVKGPSEKDALSTLLHEVQHGIQYIEGFATGGNLGMFAPGSGLTDLQNIASSERGRGKAAELARMSDEAWAKGDKAAALALVKEADVHARYQAYRRLSGEVESRNVQGRLGLTAELRRAISPELTQDVPREDVIVHFNGKEAASAPVPANAGGALRDIRFSIASADSVRDLSSRIWGKLQDHLGPSKVKSLNLWNKSVGTPFHIAEKHSEFRPVYEHLTDFTNEVSDRSLAAESLAPSLFAKMEGGVKASLSSAMKVARATMPKRLTPVEQAVNESTLEERWMSVDELRERGLNDEQIATYHQALRAAHHSLDQTAQSVMAQQVRVLVEQLRPDLSQKSRRLLGKQAMNAVLDDNVLAAADSAEEILAPYREAAREHLQEVDGLLKDARKELAEARKSGDKARIEQAQRQVNGLEESVSQAGQAAARITQTQAAVDAIAERTRDLIKKAYFPLMRFGKFTLTVWDQTDPKAPKVAYHSQYATEAQQKEAERVLAAELKDGQVIARGIRNEIAYQQFQGLNMDVLSLFADHMETQSEAGAEQAALMREYIRLATADGNALKRRLQRKGIPGYSTDVQRVLASFIISNSRLAAANLHMGDVRRAVNEIPKSKGDIQEYAQRLMQYVQQPAEEFSGLRNFMFVWYLGGSVASALTNLTQVPMVTAPYLSQFKGGSPATVLKAYKEAFGKVTDPALGSALRKAEAEGIVAPQEFYNLMATARGGQLLGGASRLLNHPTAKFGLHLWGSMFSLAEQINRRVTFIAAYRVAQHNGMSGAVAFDFATKAVDETQFVYRKENRPQWARGIGAPLFTFKMFTVQYLELLNRLPPKQKAAMLGMLVLTAGLGGLPGEEDAEDLIDTLAQWMGYNTQSRDWLEGAVDVVIGNAAATLFGEEARDKANRLALYGASELGMPFDLQSRLGMANLVPGTRILSPDQSGSSSEIAEVLGPAVGLAQNIGKAAESVARGDQRVGYYLAPRAIQNLMDGSFALDEGYYRDRQGRPVLDLTGVEAAFKTIGLQPRSVARHQEQKYRLIRRDAHRRAMEDAFLDRMALAKVRKDAAMLAKANADLDAWNRKNPDDQIRYHRAQIVRRMRALRQTSGERFLKSLSPELRGEAAAALR